METATLIKWRTELQESLAELDKRISELEAERRRRREQLDAINLLLSPVNAKGISDRGNRIVSTEVDAMTDFLSKLKEKGWFITQKSGRLKAYTANRDREMITLWMKFSHYDERASSYWFGISPERLKEMSNEKGGVILLLDTSNKYLCFTFAKLLELLYEASDTKTGRKFHIRERQGQVELLPTGTGEWVNVSRFFGVTGLQKAGIADSV